MTRATILMFALLCMNVLLGLLVLVLAAGFMSYLSFVPMAILPVTPFTTSPSNCWESNVL